MKHALALLLLSCVLVAQDKPAAEAPKPAAVAPDPFAGIVRDFKAEEAVRLKLLQAPINVRDELIVEINALKEQISRCRERLASNLRYVGDQANQSSARNSYFEHARVQHESNITLLIESQRALLLALVELAKEAAKPTAVQVHSSQRIFYPAK
jgi:hypothetical protein